MDGHHVAGTINDVEMHGVADDLAQPADGRLAGAERSRAGRIGTPRLINFAAEAGDRPGTHLQ